MPSGNFHYYLCAKLNAEATSRTQKLHCYVVKFRFTSLYGNQQLDLDLHLTGPGYQVTLKKQSIIVSKLYIHTVGQGVPPF